MSIAALFVSDAEKTIAKMRAEIHNLRHRQSGHYRMRLEELRLLAQATTLIENGEYAYGLRLLCGVMEDLRPDWREI